MQLEHIHIYVNIQKSEGMYKNSCSGWSIKYLRGMCIIYIRDYIVSGIFFEKIVLGKG